MTNPDPRQLPPDYLRAEFMPDLDRKISIGDESYALTGNPGEATRLDEAKQENGGRLTVELGSIALDVSRIKPTDADYSGVISNLDGTHTIIGDYSIHGPSVVHVNSDGTAAEAPPDATEEL